MAEVDGCTFRVSKSSMIRHERVLIKQLVLISSETELIQGPLDNYPQKIVHTPDFTGPEKLKDDSGLAYKMIRTDSLGERKVSTLGELQNGRSYLMNTFTLKNSSPLLVLTTDLLEALQYEGDESGFFEEFPQLLPLDLSEDERKFLVDNGFVNRHTARLRYVTAKSAFVQFGAAVIASGLRVIDDYWEMIAKEQGFTPHHRVFKLSQRLHDILVNLKPSIRSHGTEIKKNEVKSNSFEDQTRFFESPYSAVSEQVSFEIRHEYGREFSNGEHFGVVVPGQSINGALEISSQFKIPKYHSKNSFQQATQLNALDIAIGSPPRLLSSQEQELDMPSALINSGGSTMSSHAPSGKSGKRLLNSLLDIGSNNSVFKSKKSGENELLKLTGDLPPTSEDLNINGWKFESLPLKPSDKLNLSNFSPRGLPFYEKERLIRRLKKLTPNQVKELEHLHDSIFLNTGLQSVRKLRSRKWMKYWQYKTGIPVGLRDVDTKIFMDQYLKEVIEQTTSVITYNETTNVDETSITKRVANANFLGYSNIHGFKPPYANAPNNSK